MSDFKETMFLKDSVFTKYRCMICGRTTEQEQGCKCEVEQTFDDICDECKDAVLFVREVMSQQGVLVRDRHGSYRILKYEKCKTPFD